MNEESAVRQEDPRKVGGELFSLRPRQRETQQETCPPSPTQTAPAAEHTVRGEHWTETPVLRSIAGKTPSPPAQND